MVGFFIDKNILYLGSYQVLKIYNMGDNFKLISQVNLDNCCTRI
jgi:hypothetical protein